MVAQKNINNMARLDKEREKILFPRRYNYCLKRLKELGLMVKEDLNNKCIIIIYKDNQIRFYPYSGWASGKCIKDCRGFNKLLKQIIL